MSDPSDLPTFPPTFDPPPAYAPPPPYRPAAKPPSTAPAPFSPVERSRKRGRRRRGILAGAGAAVIVAAAVATYLLVSSGSGGAATPAAAVQALLDAGRSNNVSKATSALCAKDRALGQVAHLQSSGTITSYAIGNETTQNAVTFVDATFTTSKSANLSDEKFPVIKEGGSWKVCFSRELGVAPSAVPNTWPSGLPPLTGSTANSPGAGLPGALLPTGIPTISGVPGICSGSTSGFGVAFTYVGAAEIGVPQVAQACVYRDAVPESVAQRLGGKLFEPITTDQNASVIQFQSSDRSLKVTVVTSKKSDGKYYVVGVSIG